MLKFSERVQGFEGCMNMNHTFENIWNIFGERMGMGSTLPALFALAAIPKLCDLRALSAGWRSCMQRLCIWWSNCDNTWTHKGTEFMLSHVNHRIGLVFYKYVALTILYDLMPCGEKYICLILFVYWCNVGDRIFNRHTEELRYSFISNTNIIKTSLPH